MKSCHPGRTWIRATAFPHREKPVEVAQASASDASWTHSWGGVLGLSYCEEAQRKTQYTLEGQCLLACLGLIIFFNMACLLIQSFLGTHLVFLLDVFGLWCIYILKLYQTFFWKHTKSFQWSRSAWCTPMFRPSLHIQKNCTSRAVTSDFVLI